MQLFIHYLFKDPQFFFTVGIIVVLSVCCHEYMHAWTALKCGDPTAAERGHLTLSPFKQMGWISLLSFCFVGLAWGAVPVNPRRMRWRYGPAVVAVAGPVTNLLLSQFFLLICYAVCIWAEDNGFAIRMLFYGAVLNIVLGIFNLLPVPPLDGWSVLSSICPRLTERDSEWVRGATFLLIVLMIFSFNVLFDLAHFICETELYWITRLLAGVGVA